MKTIDGIMLKKKIEKLADLLVGNPIVSDFEEACEYIMDNKSYPYVLLDIIEEGIALVVKEEDMSILYRELRHKVLDRIHSVLAVI